MAKETVLYDLLNRAVRAKDECLWESARDLLLEATDIMSALHDAETDLEIRQQRAQQVHATLQEYVPSPWLTRRIKDIDELVEIMAAPRISISSTVSADLEV